MTNKSLTATRLLGEWRARNAALKAVLGEMKVSSAKCLETAMERHASAMYQIERSLTDAPGDVSDALGKLEIAMHYATQDAADDGEELDPNWQMVGSVMADLQRFQTAAVILPDVMVKGAEASAKAATMAA